ncbi:MAG: HesA/MoeB/ThiF family protein [Thermodesulfobacteriota bacterium]
MMVKNEEAADLREHILKCAQSHLAPDKKTWPTITLADRDRLAKFFGLAKRTVEIAALEAGVIPLRYLRNIGTLGVTGQLRLLQAKVLILGAGGLGGTVAQLLARMGLGSLILADGDSFSEDNLNRQALAAENNVGEMKVQVALKELAKINAATEVVAHAGFVREKELNSLIKGVNVAIDALDNLPSRFLLEKACRQEKVPLVHGAVAGFSGQIMVIYPEDPGFQIIYGDPQNAPEKGIEVELGNLPGIVSAVASLQVQETVKIITGLGQPLRNRLFFLDSFSATAEVISLG